MKTILEVLTELTGLFFIEDDSRTNTVLCISEKNWEGFVARITQEYANDFSQVEKERPREEDDLDSITAGSDSTQKVKIYYNSRTDTAEDIRKRIDTATDAVKLLKEKIGGK